MRKIFLIGTSIGVLLAGTILYASGNYESKKGCTQKINHLQKELIHAKNTKNMDRVNGLEISLEKVQRYCTDDGLRAKLEAKIEDKQDKLNEHTKDYNEAVADGKADKIEKYKMKIQMDNENIKILTKQLKEIS